MILCEYSENVQNTERKYKKIQKIWKMYKDIVVEICVLMCYFRFLFLVLYYAHRNTSPRRRQPPPRPNLCSAEPEPNRFLIRRAG